MRPYIFTVINRDVELGQEGGQQFFELHQAYLVQRDRIHALKETTEHSWEKLDAGIRIEVN